MHPTTAHPGAAVTAPLEILERETRQRVAAGETVQIVFDLDDTLFLVRPRKRAIFRELSATFAHEPALAQALRRLAEGEIPYDVREALECAGVAAEPHIAMVKDAFFARFFDGGYTVHDAINHGAPDYVLRLHAAGARIVYLSGRPEEMLDRTRQTLAEHGFPVDEETTAIVLKRACESHLGDVEFKGVKAAEIARDGVVLAVFDNEPANLNAMLPALPEARWFLLDTDHSPNPPALAMDAHVVRDFAERRERLEAALAASPDFEASGWKLQIEVRKRS